MTKVYVGNLGEGANRRELEKEFEYYGPLKDVWVARNPPGFAFVMFEDSRDAQDAVRKLDSSYICGQRVRVELASNDSRRGGFRGGRRGGRGGFGGGGRCYECGREGHFARDCRDRRDRGGGDRYGDRGGGGSRRYSRSRSRSRSRSPAPRRSFRSRSRTPPPRQREFNRGRSSRSRSP